MDVINENGSKNSKEKQQNGTNVKTFTKRDDKDSKELAVIMEKLKIGPKNHDKDLRSKATTIQVVSNLKKILLSNSTNTLKIFSVKFEPYIPENTFKAIAMIGRLKKNINELVGRHLAFGNCILCVTEKTEVFELKFADEKLTEGKDYNVIISPTRDNFNFSKETEESDKFYQNSKRILEKIFASILNANGKLIRFNNKNYFDFSKLDLNSNSTEPQIIPGYTTSVTVGPEGAFMRVFGKNKMINTSDCNQLIQKYVEKYENKTDEIKENFIGKSILSNYGHRKVYTIDDIDFINTVNTVKFEMRKSKDEKEEISLFDYYKNFHKKEIKDLKQPLFIVNKKQKDGKIQTIHLIPELFLPTGMDDLSKKDDEFKKSMNKTRTKPDEKMKILDKFFDYLKSEESKGMNKKGDHKLRSANEVRESWGIGISSDFESIQARELVPPELSWGGNQNFKADNGKFRSNKCLDPNCIPSWGFICQKQYDDVKKIVTNMKSASVKLGLSLAEPKIFEFGNNTKDWYDQIKQKSGEFKGLTIVLTMLPKMDVPTYKAIKNAFYKGLGMPSQCLVVQKHKGGNLSSITNVINQMIVKCQGRLYNIHLGNMSSTLNTPSSVIGIETSAAGKETKYSFVATINKQHNKVYCDEIFKPKNDKSCHPINEFIDKLTSKFQDRLSTFIIYRSGGSSFANKEILKDEVYPLKLHLEDYEKKKGKKLKAAFVLSNKQAELKFFAKKNNFLENPRAGLCVDEVVVDKKSYEFFIQPQFVNQGCATPTKFSVLMDDTDMSYEEMQQVTYHLCYYYWNWAGAVREPSVLKFSQVMNKFTGSIINGGKINKEEIKSAPYFI
jgi:aubergine-like protein